MKNQTLMSDLVRLIVRGTVTGFLLLNGMQSVGQKPSVLAQTPPQTTKEQDPHHPQVSPSPSTSSSPSGMGMMNKQNVDRHFIEMMIPHHQMAVMMAARVLNSSHPELRNLAKSIIQIQSAEIEQMRRWQ